MLFALFITGVGVERRFHRFGGERRAKSERHILLLFFLFPEKAAADNPDVTRHIQKH